MTDLNAFPQFPLCNFCDDLGLTYTPEFPPAYRFCACAEGVKKQMSEPEAVREANEQAERLKKTAIWPPGRVPNWR